MIVTRNLYKGLTATVLGIENDKIHIEIAADEHLQHGMERKIFEIEKYSFTVCEMDGSIAASRCQFPLRLGYATTVDKAQGRTIASLVVDCYNLWKFAQMGVGIG